MQTQILLIVFAPLLAAVVAGLGNRMIGNLAAKSITTGALILSAILSWPIFLGFIAGTETAEVVQVLKWVESGSLSFDWALRVDTLTAVMLVVINTVSAIVHIYSWGYMEEDPDQPRFFAYLSLFTFAMLMLVTADNLVQMFFGWEGVGLASYLLIGFWFKKPSANAAAIKAFVVNRVGDLGFMLGIFGTYLVFQTTSIPEILAEAPAMSGSTITFVGMRLYAMDILCILLFIGAMGKSAQLGLHTWLPDAMEGPTPVSALIHAATMVTAGVFMVCRLSPMFETAPTALMVVTVIGAATCFFAATIGTTQWDIKRVIAYSTCSQLGYMFFACGVSAYSAGIFHLMTHGFFKALLFLGAGSVIHAMSDEQDMRKMGGIWKHIKVTYILMWIGSLALAGIPPFAGFYSKDIVLEAAWGAHTGVGQYAFWLGITAAFLTAFYSWRLLIMTFHGAPRADETTMAHVHESPMVMVLPLVVLAGGACLAGVLAYDLMVGHQMAEFWGKSIVVLEHHKALENAHHVPLWVKLLPLVVGVAGIAMAYVFYMFAPGIPGAIAARFQGVYQFLLNKWYFDELYDKIFVKPSFYLGRNLWKTGDGTLIDGLGPDGVSAAVKHIARRASALQTGYLYHYAFAMLAGIVVLVTWYLLTKAG